MRWIVIFNSSFAVVFPILEADCYTHEQRLIPIGSQVLCVT